MKVLINGAGIGGLTAALRLGDSVTSQWSRALVLTLFTFCPPGPELRA